MHQNGKSLDRGVGPMVDRVHQILPVSFSPVIRRSYSLVSPPTDFFLNETVDSMQEPPSEEFLNETVEFTHSPSVIVGSHTPDLHQSQQDFTHNEESGELSMGVMNMSLESYESTVRVQSSGSELALDFLQPGASGSRLYHCSLCDRIPNQKIIQKTFVCM